MHITDNNDKKMQQDMPQKMQSTISPGVFLLIDSAQYPAIWKILRYRFRRLPWLSLFEHTSNPDDIQGGPVLIQVETNQTRTASWFLDAMKDMHCLSWIMSPLSLAALRVHLSGLLQVEAEDGSACVMRYCDTRILPVWHYMLDPLQKAHVMNPITNWSYVNREGVTCTLKGKGQAAASDAYSVAPPNAAPPFTLTLTQGQENALIDALYPDVIIQQLENSGNAALRDMSSIERYRFIVDQIDKARTQYHITSTPEIVLFCSLALDIGDNFDCLQPVAQVLENFARQSISCHLYASA